LIICSNVGDVWIGEEFRKDKKRGGQKPDPGARNRKGEMFKRINLFGIMGCFLNKVQRLSNV
jgi:hypothetical protein